MSRLIAKPQAALLAVLSFVLCPSSFAHALDPELTAPYKVQVVLRVAPNRLLTPIFKEQLRRDLQQGLQAALGAMGEVEVIDVGEVKPEKQEALWKEVAAKGLQAGLDGSGKGTSAVKTHFVTVDYADGQYEIQARQYDGLTGTASPAVRRERTPDRQFVGRTAALLVDRDFGLVGTVTDGGDGQAVRVTFKGGGLKVPLDRWVKKGDVFALVRVGADGRTTPVKWSLLQADAPPGEDGSCACKLFPPQQKPLATAGAGFRCLKLGTVRAPVRVHVVEWQERGPPRPLKESAVIEVRRHNFKEVLRDTDGTLVSNDFASTEKLKEPLYDGVAFVTILYGGQVRAQVPLPLVDERTVTLPIKLGPEPPRFLVERSLWEQSLLNEQLMLGDLFKDLNDALGKPDSRAPALERARTALDRLSQRLKLYAEQRDELAKMKPVKGGQPLDLSKGNGRLQDVQKGRDDLSQFVGRVDKILKEENDSGRQEARATFEQARNLETEGDYGRAIELYEKVLAATKDAKLEERLTKLKEAWQTKGDAHRKARAFIYDTWPKLEAPVAMKERVKQAQDALKVCRDAKDPLGPRKLLAVALLHAKKLSQQAEALAPDVNEEDRKSAEELAEVLDQLANLIKDAKTAVAETPAP
jgi:hypothetical protein